MHKHLSKSERCKIEVYFQEGFTISANEGEAGVTLLGFSFNGSTILAYLNR